MKASNAHAAAPPLPKLGRSSLPRSGPAPTPDEMERVRAVLAATPLFDEVKVEVVEVVERLLAQRKARRVFRGLAVLAELTLTSPSPNRAMIDQALRDCHATDGMDVDANVARMLLILHALQRRRKT
jgi:hypothetical protein